MCYLVAVDHEGEGEGDDDGYDHVAGLHVEVGAVPGVGTSI